LTDRKAANQQYGDQLGDEQQAKPYQAHPKALGYIGFRRCDSIHAGACASWGLRTVHWQNGGPAVIKGVASLPDDM